MDDSHDPIRPDELDGLFARFAALAPCALAVSGGSDSTALMVVFADWLRLRGEDFGGYSVLTVDHGLRAEAAAEARAVAAAAHGLGYRHTTLVWQGPKPATGIQAAARAARYRLMGDHLRAHGLRFLLTAHTRDDQAETVLMRLARGSGIDGLAAMSPVSPLSARHTADAGGGGLWIVRPLLDVPKSCLRATLEARGVAWIEDPGNAAPEFERARLRAARASLDALGLTPAMLALSAARLAGARRALEASADRLCDPREDVVRVDHCGFVAIDRARLRQAGEEVALRVLDRVIAAAGGAGEPVPLGKLEAIVAAVCDPVAAASGRWTLARALITARSAAEVEVEREPGREPLPELTLEPGRTALWDGRFRVTVGARFAGGGVRVRALGEAGLREVRRRGRVLEGTAARAAAAAPSMWHNGRLMAAPPLRFWTPPHTGDDLGAVFLGLEGAAGRSESDPLRQHGSSNLRQRRGV
ncbi:MAG TPA: tRNA lysidine(34) synthetase TilS [Hyphomicrobiaceae bacterium]